jgi:hypothetical protein
LDLRVAKGRLMLQIIKNMYKRFLGVIDDRQQLQEVCKHSSSSFKFSNDGRCNMMIPIARW